MVTAERIRRFAPRARPDLVAAIVENWSAAEAAGINTPLRVPHFMAQIATETGGFRAIEENLNYSSDRLRQVFPSRVSAALAKKLAGNPKAIANHVYGSRLGNRKGTDDGWVYRGSGFIQTTGRSNFAAVGAEDDPDSLRRPDEGFLAAVAYWEDRGCNAAADADNLTKVRRLVNGGTNGLAEAKVWLAKAKRIFTGVAPTKAPTVSAKLPRFEVEAIQKRLRELGYFMVGKVDGIWGENTTAAIAALQHRAGITVDGKWGPETKRALADDANRKVVSPERQHTTLADLRAQGSTTIVAADKAEAAADTNVAAAGTVAGVSAVGGVGKVISDWIDPVRETVQPILDFITSIPSEWWFLVIGSLAAITVFNAIRAKRAVDVVKQARLESERSGLHAGEPDPSPSPPITDTSAGEPSAAELAS
jgi:putative chitinase